MRHFFRSQLPPADVMERADVFFRELGLTVTNSAPRARTYQGIVGTPEIVANVRLSARAEGGHYTFVEAVTDQMGESRVDRQVKRFFVELHRAADPRHTLEAAY